MKKAGVRFGVLKELNLQNNYSITLDLIDKFGEIYSGNSIPKGTISEIRYNRRLAALSLVKYKRLNKVPAKDIQEGFIYILSNPSWEGYYKVGYSIDPRDRLKQYQTGCPFSDYKLEGYYFSFNVRATEKDIHAKLKRFHIKGEWFKLNLPNLQKFILRQGEIMK